MTFPNSNSRITSFNKEWLYINITATRNQTIKIKVTFKNDLGGSSKPRYSAINDAQNIEEILDQSLMGSTSKPGADGPEAYDFSNFSLGQGKLQDKRKVLLGWLERLTTNKKMEAAHRKYCDEIKRKR